MSLKRNPVESSNNPNKHQKLDAKLIEEIFKLVEPYKETPYFKAIYQQADGLYSIYEEAIVKANIEALNNLAKHAKTIATLNDLANDAKTKQPKPVDVYMSSIDAYIDSKRWSKKMQNLASTLAAIENSDQPIPQIQELVDGDGWKEWRAIFSTENMKNVLKMTNGKQSKDFLTARLFSFAAYRMGLSVVNKHNGLEKEKPPPHMNNAPYDKDGANQEYIYESMRWTLLGLLAVYNGDDENREINDGLRNKSKKGIDGLKERWDRVINRKNNITDDSAATTWGKHKQMYKARLGSVLRSELLARREKDATEGRSFLPPMRLNYSKSGMFNPFKSPPTNLEFDEAKIVIEEHEWSGLISSFYDPVMFWIDDKIKEAKVNKTSAQIQEQLKEAKAFDPSFLVEDRQEAERRLSLYETYSLWDTMIQAVEKIFVAEKEYSIASRTYDLFYYGNVVPSMNDAERARVKLNELLGAERAKSARVKLNELLDENTVEEIVNKYKDWDATNVTKEQLRLYDNRIKAEQMVEQRVNEYGIYLQQNRQFLACAEIASSLLRGHIANAKDDPHTMAYSGTSAVQTPEIQSSIKRTAALFRKPFTGRLRLTPCLVPRSATSVSQTCRQTTARVPRQAVPPPPQDLVCVLNARFALLGV